MNIRKGYNPETDKNATHLVTPDAEIFIADTGKVMQAIYNSRKDFVIDEYQYDRGEALATSDLVLTQHARGIDPVWRYKANIEWNDPTGTTDRILPAVTSAITERSDVDVSMSPFSNTRLIRDRHVDGHALLAVFEANKRLLYTNDGGLKVPNVPAEVVLNAPTLLQLDRRPGAHFIIHVANYVIALNAVSRALSGHPIRNRFIITPDGPMYEKRSARKSMAQVVGPTSNTQSKVEKLEPTTKAYPRFEDIGGLFSLRKELESVATSFKKQEAMQKWGAVRPQGVFLYGPGGTGKTMYAKALANEIEGELVEVNCTEVFTRWLGESEANMQSIFEKAKQATGPTVLFFDEFDAIAGSGREDAMRSERAVEAIFKTEAAKLREHNPNVILFAATNKDMDMSSPLVRAGRFDIKRHVPLPDKNDQLDIMTVIKMQLADKLETESFKIFADDISLTELADAMEGMDATGADIAEVFRRATFAKAVEDSDQPITQQDLLAVITDMRQ